MYLIVRYFSFFFNAPATTEIYTLSLHDALPICSRSLTRIRASATRNPPRWGCERGGAGGAGNCRSRTSASQADRSRSEEHTSELQSHSDLVCRLLLEKKKTHKRQMIVDSDNEKE